MLKFSGSYGGGKLLGLSVARSLVKEILVPDVTLSADKTKLIARLAGTTAKGQNLLANKSCPFAVVPALQSIWFYKEIRIQETIVLAKIDHRNFVPKSDLEQDLISLLQSYNKDKLQYFLILFCVIKRRFNCACLFLFRWVLF